MKKHKLRKSLLKAHIYSGLFASVFLLFVGISALNFQHHFLNTGKTSHKKYSTSINFDSSLAKDSLAKSIIDSLHLIGTIPWWKLREDKQQNVQFSVSRPGTRYDIKLNRVSKNISITEVKFGFGSIIVGLHTSILGKPKSWHFMLWAIYAQTSIFLVLFTIITSIYFWFKKVIMKKSDWLIVIVAALFSTTLILYLWLAG